MNSNFDCRVRSIVLEHETAPTVDFLVKSLPGFDQLYQEIELMLARWPNKIGIRGVTCDDLGIGLYLHISDGFPPIDVLYRFDNEKVYIESIAVGAQTGLVCCEGYEAFQ